MKNPRWYKINEDGSYSYKKVCKKCGEVTIVNVWTDRIGQFYKEYKKKYICTKCKKKK